MNNDKFKFRKRNLNIKLVELKNVLISSKEHF